ncbi:MAG TPA: hypothetical protein VKW06_16170 [Candidatus Angelobacter sp.]|nr:hypothetical protein [Candidatus Angelobacter sp.]
MYVDFRLRVVADTKPLANPALKRFSLVFQSDDGDVTIHGCLFHEIGHDVMGPSILIGRRPFDIVDLSPRIQEELRKEFVRRDFFRPRQRRNLPHSQFEGFALKEFRNGR